jgi:hypothetical protein
MSRFAVAAIVEASKAEWSRGWREENRDAIEGCTEERDELALSRYCLIPRFDGVILSQEWKEALWDKFVTGAPRPRTPSELQYSDRKLRSRS